MFCCTYVALENAMVPDQYPLPRADEVLEYLAGYPLCTTVDEFSGHHAMALDGESIPLTAFLAPYEFMCGQYCPSAFVMHTAL